MGYVEEQQEEEAYESSEEEEEEEKISLAHIKALPLPVWFIFAVCATFYVGVLVFYGVAVNIFEKTGRKYSSTTSALFIAIPNLVSVFASPSFGRLIDKRGRALNWIIVACTMMIMVHVAFLLNALEVIEITPIALMIWLGTAYSMGAAAMWPIVSLIVPKVVQGTAYGMMTAVQNSALAIFPIIIGQLQDKYSDSRLQYTLPLMLFIGCEVVALFLTFTLIGLDRKFTEGRLNMSASERDALDDENEANAIAASAKVQPSSVVVSPRSAHFRVLDEEEKVIKIVPRRAPVRHSYLSRLGIHRPSHM